jgi:transposase-like protein
MAKKLKRFAQLEPSLKAKILSESMKPGCVISDLARSYGISPARLYGWRSDLKYISTSNDSKFETKLDSKTEVASKFVELTLNSEEIDCNTHPQEKAFIKKAIITFDNFSMSLEGRVNKELVVHLLKLSEELC